MEKHINDINTSINGTLKELLPASDLHAFGLAESIAVRDDSSDVTFPAIVLPNGECYSVFGETDKHDVTLYHRLNEISFQEDSKVAYGNNHGYLETDDMSLIVFGKRSIISPFQMEKIARQAIAAINSNAIVRSDFNSLHVFANEYIGVTYFLPPAFFLFKINYRITSTYNARCAKIEQL